MFDLAMFDLLLAGADFTEASANAGRWQQEPTGIGPAASHAFAGPVRRLACRSLALPTVRRADR